MRSRIVILLLVLTFLWASLLGRAAFLQLIPDQRMQTLEKKQFDTVVTLHARRGDILDRNGHEIAVSMTAYSLFADPKTIEQPKLLAKILAGALDVPSRSIEEKFHDRTRRFVWIERRMDRKTHDQIDEKIKEYHVKGLGFVEESRRIYPNERLLSHAIGFIGRDENGLEGLELHYNDQLQATKKRVNMHRDAHGRPLIVGGQIFNEAPDGVDVQLTIDREMQFVLEQELVQTVHEHEADSAMGIVLDAQTSEILAMASVPSFDPNRPQDFSPEVKRDHLVSDVFEPGSTMKTFVMAGALNAGLIEPNTKIDCEGGVMQLGKRIIREADTKHKFGILTASEILAYSSNVGASKVAFKLGDAKLKETLTSFGFGEKTGVDLPGEAKGLMQGLPWHEHLLANISFGQGIATTALQMANAYAAIANGGWLKQPSIVKSLRDHESGEVSEMKPQTIRRVLSESAAAKLRLMLMGVTSGEGTGVNARVAGFPVAGKTGTAQKINSVSHRYTNGGYVSSFAGFLPANDPKFVIYIVVDHPRKEYYAASVAAPVFSHVAKFAVRRAGLEPILITQDDVVPKIEKAREVARAPIASPGAKTDAPSAMDHIPDLRGLSLREALERVTGQSMTVDVHGQGTVVRTIPAPGATLPSSKSVSIYLEK